LINYHWPGNVRELQNLVERLVIMAEQTTVGFKELPSYMTVPPEKENPQPVVDEPASAPAASRPAARPTRNLEEIEKREVEAALLRHGWVQARAARELGLTQRQIGYKIKKYAITPPDYLR
jgi:Nif-specific regulatory protein